MSNPLDFVQKPSVLIVDDTLDNLTLMSGLLKNLYKVRIANSGEKALKLVQGDAPPDLILLDIMMPEMSGHEVCRILKRDPATAHIPHHLPDRAHQHRGREEGTGARRGRLHHQAGQPAHPAGARGYAVASEGGGRFPARPERIPGHGSAAARARTGRHPPTSPPASCGCISRNCSGCRTSRAASSTSASTIRAC